LHIDRPGAVVVRDPHDTPATKTLLARIDDLARGVLVVRPVPGTNTLSTLGLAVLAALGKQVDPPPRGQQRRLWPLARAWTVGHQPDYLVIDRAHTLPRPLIHALLDLAAAAGAMGVWFLDATPDRTASGLARLDAAHERPQQLLNLGIMPRDLPAPLDDLRIPPLTLPDVGFLTFRAACQRLLPPADAALADSLWRVTFDRTYDWLQQIDVYDAPPAAGSILNQPGQFIHPLSVRLAASLYNASNPAGAVVRLRAVQAALLRHGLLLHHEPRMGMLPGQMLGCPLTPDVAHTINRTLPTPDAAAAVLHLIHPFQPDVRPARPWRRRWRLADIEPDGSLVHTEYGTIPVPTCGQPILRAHLHWLNPAGDAAPNTDLFTDTPDPENLAAHTLNPLGLLSPTPMRYQRTRAYLRGHGTVWMRHRGLELSPLSDLEQRTTLPAVIP
jgi:hypothetical protein